MPNRIHITEDMRAAIGQESEPWVYEVTTTSVRAFARGAGYTDPVFFDEEAARKAGYRNLPCPPTYLGTPAFVPGKCHDTFSNPLDVLPALRHGLRNALDGSIDIEYFTDICAGDTLTAVSAVAGLKSRYSRALRCEMLIVTVETNFTNQRGELAARQRTEELYY